MSADNYFVIRRHPRGGFAAVMGFASDNEHPEARDNHEQFDTWHAAIEWATRENTEYGPVVHEECKHRPGCRAAELNAIGKTIGCLCHLALK